MRNGHRAGLIIIVDDDAAVRRSLTLLLAAYDWDAVSFSSAHDLLASGLPRDRRLCLVVDQQMPGMTGLDLLAALRSAGHRQPAILVTGLVDGRRRIEQAAREIPGTVFLHKPIDADQFVHCVQRCIDAAIVD
ncbi:response regulator transcription factor [Stella sp.]|uniref:response regulator transcription factor n=1 Tax=Stella sp. TaxID=2912054 RepID=UPI0035B3EE8E